VRGNLQSVLTDLRSVKGNLRSVLTDLRSVKGNLQSVLTYMRSVKGNLQSVLTDWRSVKTNLRSVLIDLKDFGPACCAQTVGCGILVRNFEIAPRDHCGRSRSLRDRCDSCFLTPSMLSWPLADETMPTDKPIDHAKLDRIVAGAARDAERRSQGYRERALKCIRGSAAVAVGSSRGPTCKS